MLWAGGAANMRRRNSGRPYSMYWKTGALRIWSSAVWTTWRGSQRHQGLLSPHGNSEVCDASNPQFYSLLSYKDTKKLLANLKPVFTAPKEDAALSTLDDFEKTWGTRYPLVVQPWRRNWGDKYPTEIRKLFIPPIWKLQPPAPQSDSGQGRFPQRRVSAQNASTTGARFFSSYPSFSTTRSIGIRTVFFTDPHMRVDAFITLFSNDG